MNKTKLVIIDDSMLMLGDFDSWDFLKKDDEICCVKKEVIAKLSRLKNDNPNFIVQKKINRAFNFLYKHSLKYKIVSEADLLNTDYYDKIYLTADIGNYLLLSSNHEEVKLWVSKENDNFLTLDSSYWEQITDFNNPLKLLTNQYFTIMDSQKEKPVLFKVDKDLQYKPVKYQMLESDNMGEIKPKDARQLAAIDSLRNNQLTMLMGKSGTGKSHLALAALFSKLQKQEIDKIYMFCNPVATRDSARLGFYAGTKDQKLLDSQIGNFLDGKIGERTGVERLMREGKLSLFPMSDIRGFDSNGKKAGIYITEAQNSTIDLMQLALERVGEDCICIIDGDYRRQVDLDVYADINNGMRQVSKTYIGQDFYGEVCLKNVYRSRVAEIAAKMTEE